jgi:hypothetical protein
MATEMGTRYQKLKKNGEAFGGGLVQCSCTTADIRP